MRPPSYPSLEEDNKLKMLEIISVKIICAKHCFRKQYPKKSQPILEAQINPSINHRPKNIPSSQISEPKNPLDLPVMPILEPLVCTPQQIQTCTKCVLDVQYGIYINLKEFVKSLLIMYNIFIFKVLLEKFSSLQVDGTNLFSTATTASKSTSTSKCVI